MKLDISIYVFKSAPLRKEATKSQMLINCEYLFQNLTSTDHHGRIHCQRSKIPDPVCQPYSVCKFAHSALYLPVTSFVSSTFRPPPSCLHTSPPSFPSTFLNQLFTSFRPALIPSPRWQDVLSSPSQSGCLQTRQSSSNSSTRSQKYYLLD